MDSYQAIYDAVRSKIQGGNVSDAIQEAFRNTGFDHAASQAFRIMADEFCVAWTAPHVVHKLIPYMDGDKWCALLGEDIQVGICGFGETPAKACAEFDAMWNWGFSNKNKPQPSQEPT